MPVVLLACRRVHVGTWGPESVSSRRRQPTPPRAVVSCHLRRPHRNRRPRVPLDPGPPQPAWTPGPAAGRDLLDPSGPGAALADRRRRHPRVGPRRAGQPGQRLPGPARSDRRHRRTGTGPDGRSGAQPQAGWGSSPWTAPSSSPPARAVPGRRTRSADPDRLSMATPAPAPASTSASRAPICPSGTRPGTCPLAPNAPTPCCDPPSKCSVASPSAHGCASATSPLAPSSSWPCTAVASENLTAPVGYHPRGHLLLSDVPSRGAPRSRGPT